jgi:hypothetical protein
MATPRNTGTARQLSAMTGPGGKLSPQGLVGIMLSAGQQGGVRTFKFAAIPATYTTGRPTLIFDGDATATVATWPYLSSYTPAANDRVAVAMTEHSGFILGKLV